MARSRSAWLFAGLVALGCIGVARLGVAQGLTQGVGAIQGVGLVQEKTDPAAQPAAPLGVKPGADPASPAPAPGSDVAPPDEPTPPVAAEAQAEAAPPPAPVKPPEPLKRPRFASAILQATDKVTAETLRFEARVGEPVRYKSLVLTVRACEGAAADEGFSDSIANVEVLSQPQIAGRAAVSARQVFRGWLFAGSPSLHPVEHPGYDVWLIACKTASGPGASA